MSGIAGLMAMDGRPIEQANLAKMLEAIAHRGRDGQFMAVDGRAGLAHAAFRTSAEAPLSPDLYDDGRIIVSADARLDDRAAMADALGLAADEISDAQLICAAYRRWGNACPEHMTGDFALALWDRDARQLFCARDHFGVKPFYYTLGPAFFAFGSEIKALLRAGIGHFQVREEAIGEYLAGMNLPPGKTFYANIFSLLPAHSLVVSEAGINIVKYWSLKFGGVKTSASPTEDFIRLFGQAVERRMRSGRPVGALLSGGLDSSSIVRMAAPRFAADHSGGLPTISAVFDKTPQWSERAFIEAVTGKGDCNPSMVPLDGYAPLGDLAKALDAQDAPFFAPGLAMTRGLHETARDRELAVLLDGHGGDETVSHGYRRLDDLAKDRQWLKLWREMSGVFQMYGGAPHVSFLNSYLFYGPFRPLLFKARRLVNAVRRRTGGPPGHPQWMAFVRQDFADRIQLADHRAALAPKPVFGAQAQHLADLTSPLHAGAFEILDRQAAAAGVELRFPFWDKDFAEFCLNLPAEWKLDGGWSRLVLRKAMEGRLPPEVQWRRTKLDFKPHFALGMLAHHTALIEDVIFKDSGQIGTYADLEALAAAYHRMKTLREKTPLSDLAGIYRAVVLSEWNRKLL